MVGPSEEPFDPSTDPLGAALMSRAADDRINDQVQTIAHGGTPGPGPLPDVRWDAFWTAMQDAAGNKPVRVVGSAGPDLGFDTNNGTVGAGTEVYGPRGLRLNKEYR